MQDLELADYIPGGSYGELYQILAIFLGVVFLHFSAKFVFSYLQKRFKKQDSLWKKNFVKALSAPFKSTIWLIAFTLSGFIILKKLGLSIESHAVRLILSLSVIFGISWFLFSFKNYVLLDSYLKSKEKQISFDRSQIDVIGKLATIVIILLTLMLVFSASGLDMTTLIAFGGVGGLALAIASQDVISNFFGGLMIYITRPFSVGDWIVLAEKKIEGHVEEIGWYMTSIRTLGMRPVYIPNSTFSKTYIETPSRMVHRQIKETIGLRYSDDKVLEAVITDLRGMLETHPDIDQTQKIRVFLSQFGESSLDIVVLAHTLHLPNKVFEYIKEDVLFKIMNIVKKHGAEMAFATRTLDVPGGIIFREK